MVAMSGDCGNVGYGCGGGEGSVIVVVGTNVGPERVEELVLRALAVGEVA